MEKEILTFIGDMHIAPEETGADRAQSNLDRPPRRKEHLIRVLKEIGQYKNGETAMAFYGGDNTNQPMNRPGYPETLLPILDGGPKPYRIIPGNHDVGSTVGWHHHDPAIMKESIAAFRRTFGEDYWIQETAGFQIIGINSQIFGSSLDEARKQEEWLTETLARPCPRDLVRAVFLHTPPYLKDWDDDFSDGSEQMCLRPEARKPLKEILLSHPPELLISAHVHRFWVRKEPKWWWLGIPATALPLSEIEAVPDHNVPSGEDRLGWVSLIRVTDSWEAELHPIETIT